MTAYPEINVVAAVLINAKTQILLAQRPLDKRLGGCWEFPGGKIEAGESKEQALIRELEEELSIEVQEDKLILLHEINHKYQEFHLKMTVYALHEWQNEVQNNEHLAHVWVDVERMNEYPLPPADIDIIAALQIYLKVYQSDN